MTYNFTPLTDEQIDALNLLEEGIYNFEVIKAERKVSKSGNPMAELQLNVWDNSGKNHLVYDYLVFSSINLNIRKVKHFCDSVGLSDQYKEGSIPEELERYAGQVKIGIKEQQPNPNGGFYPKKNHVIDYVLDSPKEKGTIESLEEDNFLNDQIPF